MDRPHRLSSLRPSQNPSKTASHIGMGLSISSCSGAVLSAVTAWGHPFADAPEVVEGVLLWVVSALLVRLAWICAMAARLCRHTDYFPAAAPPEEPRYGAATRRMAELLLLLAAALLASPAQAVAPADPGHSISTSWPAPDLAPREADSTLVAQGSTQRLGPDFLPRIAVAGSVRENTHLVRDGETLWGIAASALPPGASPTRIAAAVTRWQEANPQLGNPDHLETGDVLHLPTSTEEGPRP